MTKIVKKNKKTPYVKFSMVGIILNLSLVYEEMVVNNK